MDYLYFVLVFVWNLLALIGAVYVGGVIIATVREWRYWRQIRGRDL